VRYKVDFTPQALEDISKLDRNVIERITKKIEWLSESLDSISPQALKGKLHGAFKLVIGNWRVIYLYTRFRKQGYNHSPYRSQKRNLQDLIICRL
jgi:mRNA interferase RelE/StbE